MPRLGVSFDEVAAVADSMMAEGLTPTIRIVRERLGTGSLNTIHNHLTAWREALPQFTSEMIELPATIATAFSKEIGRAKSEAKAESEARLVIFQTEAAELAADGKKREDEREVLLEELKVITTDREMLRGTLQEQSGEIDRLTKENDRERYAAEQARTEVAQIRNKIDMQAERLLELSAIIDQLTTKN
ncbi:MAG: DNA-binding protein, partial [Desulfuromonadaceae bacterium]|nr:DNA-binding protein [Desulfuromonadaceae bacterium]